MIRYTVRDVTPRTTSYTIKKDQPDKSGSVFSNKGATGAVTFTLPAPKASIIGTWYEFLVETAQSLIVAAATAGDLIADGNIAADNVGFQVAGQKVGGRILAMCDGASWVCIGTRAGGGFCVNGTPVSPNTGVTINELAVLAGVVAGTASASKALVVDANKDLDAAALRSRILGAGNNYKIARGENQQATASDTVVTGLATVVAVVIAPRTVTVKQLFFQASIGDQAGTPAAGSILITSKKPTAVNDVTPTAATDFTDNIKVNWIAIGT